MEKQWKINLLSTHGPEINQPKPILITELVAQGGQALIFKGLMEDSEEKEVIIKIFKNQNDAVREEQILGMLRNSNIPKLFGRTSSSQGVGLVIQYMPGLSLRHWLNNRPSPLDYGKLAQEILELLAYVHSLGILHNDLSPDNLILDPSKGAVLIDFAAASLGPRLGNVPFGQMQYLAPEVLFGYEESSQSDLYSLGASLFEVVSGELFNSEKMGNSFDTLAQALKHYHEPRLFMLVKCLLAPTPWLRPSSAQAALFSLGQLREEKGVLFQEEQYVQGFGPQEHALVGKRLPMVR